MVLDYANRGETLRVMRGLIEARAGQRKIVTLAFISSDSVLKYVRASGVDQIVKLPAILDDEVGQQFLKDEIGRSKDKNPLGTWRSDVAPHPSQARYRTTKAAFARFFEVDDAFGVEGQLDSLGRFARDAAMVSGAGGAR